MLASTWAFSFYTAFAEKNRYYRQTRFLKNNTGELLLSRTKKFDVTAIATPRERKYDPSCVCSKLFCPGY
jgi:hypothetical protein